MSDVDNPVRTWHRLKKAADRLHVPLDALVTAVEDSAALTPAGAETPTTHLSAEAEQALRDAGSLGRAMPPFGERASTRTALLAARLLADSYIVKEAAELLGVSPGRVRQRLKDRTLFGVQVDGEWRVPSFQFRDGRQVPGLDKVLPRLPRDLSLSAVHGFLTRPNLDLQGDVDTVSPLDWLADLNDTSPVSRLADGLHHNP